MLTVATSAPAEGVRVITVAGEIDAYSVAPLRAAVAAMTADFPPGGLVLDLSAVTFLSAAGLDVLSEVLDEGSRRGHAVRIVATGRAVRRVFDLIGLEDPAIVHDSPAAALSSLA